VSLAGEVSSVTEQRCCDVPRRFRPREARFGPPWGHRETASDEELGLGRGMEVKRKNRGSGGLDRSPVPPPLWAASLGDLSEKEGTAAALPPRGPSQQAVHFDKLDPAASRLPTACNPDAQHFAPVFDMP